MHGMGSEGWIVIVMNAFRIGFWDDLANSASCLIIVPSSCPAHAFVRSIHP